MIELNLPKAKLDLRKIRDNVYDVYDPIRKKYVRLTAEEWVRQSFIYYITEYLSYPKSLIMNEAYININGLKRRADSVIYNRELKPIVLIEYKSPRIKLSQAVVDQALNYNMKFRVKYLIISNGLRHLCWQIDRETGEYEPMNDFPTREQII